MFETTQSPGCSQRSEFVWHRSFVKRKKLMKGKERKIRRDGPPRGRGVSGRFRIKDKKGFERPVIIQWVSTWLKVSQVLQSQVTVGSVGSVSPCLMSQGTRRPWTVHLERPSTAQQPPPYLCPPPPLPEIIYALVFVIFLFNSALL